MRSFDQRLPLHGPSSFELFNPWLSALSFAYGWIGLNPLRSVADATFNTLTQSLHTGKGASRDLRNLFYGAVVWLPTVLLTRRWRRMARALKSQRPLYNWNIKELG